MVQKVGNLEGVLSAYQKIVELSPRNVDIRNKLADLYASQGKPEDAVRELHAVAEFYQEHNRSHEAEAVEAKIRRLTGVEPSPPPESPKAAEAAAFSPPPGFQTSGVSFESLFPEVAAPPQTPEIKIEETAVPPFAEAKTEEAFAAAKPPSEAKGPSPEAVTEKPPEDWAVSVELGELLLDIGSTQEATEQFHRAAEGYFNSGDLGKAQGLYRRISELQPLEIRTRQKLVEIALKRDIREEIIEAYLGLAECLLRRDRKEQSASVYHKVLELDPKNEAALENLSVLAPQPQAAVSPAREQAPPPKAAPAAGTPPLKEPAPLAPSLLVGEAAASEVVTPPPVAAPEKPKEPLAPSLLGQERPPEAGEPIESEKVMLGREIVEGGRKSHVKFAVTENEPTAAAEEALSISDIIEEFKEGVFKTVSQEDFASHYDLGIAYKEMGLLEESIMEFQIAAKGEAEKLKSLEMLGICFLDKEEPQFAIRQFEQGLAVPGHPPEAYLGLHYYHATACERLGDLEGAVKHLDEVYLVDAKFMDAAARLKSLKAQLKKKGHAVPPPPPAPEAEARIEEIFKEAPEPPFEVAPTPVGVEEKIAVPEPVQAASEPVEVSPAEDFLSSVHEMIQSAVSGAGPAGEGAVTPEGPLPVSEAAVEPEPIPTPEPEPIPEPPVPEKPKPEVPKKRKISYV